MRSLILIAAIGSLHAAPVLRLTNTVVGPVAVPVGVAGPAQTVEAYNIGGGALSLTVSVSPSTPWVSASVGAAGPCRASYVPGPCVPVTFEFQTQDLPTGIYTAEVRVSDINAIDAPQTVTVTVWVGGPPPLGVDQYLAPGAMSSTEVSPDGVGYICPPATCPAVTASTQDGAQWLSIAETWMGTLGARAFAPRTYHIQVHPPPGMAAGTYSGTVAINSPTYNKTIPVTLRVTTQPIASPSHGDIHLRLAHGGPAVSYPFLPSVSVNNTGAGTLVVNGVTASGAGIGAYNNSADVIVTVDPGSLAPGTYPGAIAIDCNAVNCPVRVPVTLEIVPPGAPLIYYRGALDNAAFQNTTAPGDVMVVKGEQFTLSPPVFASTLPLPVSLGGAGVLVNGAAAPLYYVSSGQIAFQMPADAATGAALVQVQRDSEPGNTVSVAVVPRAPQIAAITDTSYNLRDGGHPAHPGDTLILWAIGLGATNPPIPSGTPAPVDPLAIVTASPLVQFAGRTMTPSFACLAPGLVGIYQVIFTLPADTPTGLLSISLSQSGAVSFTSPIFIQ